MSLTFKNKSTNYVRVRKEGSCRHKKKNNGKKMIWPTVREPGCCDVRIKVTRAVLLAQITIINHHSTTWIHLVASTVEFDRCITRKDSQEGWSAVGIMKLYYSSSRCVLQIHNATLTVHAQAPGGRETGGVSGALEGSKSIQRKRDARRSRGETHDRAKERLVTAKEIAGSAS